MATAAEETVHRYFQRIEEVFIGLRGAPLLLSPSDWRIAQDWKKREIPFEVVEKALEEVFERRKARGDERRVQGLRYCAPAVEAAWQEIEELQATGRREPAAPAFDVAARLAALAAALPAEAEAFGDRIRHLDGPAEAVEDALSRLDNELLSALEVQLTAEQRQDIAERSRASLAVLAERLPADELQVARRRLMARWLRRILSVPVLSLFSPEAEKT
ncbi:MAG: hypothetical protein AAF481_02965 [Acidobacteriota bacterium]